jgi:hypothetical protein
VALGDGTHKLAVKTEVRQVIGKRASERVAICLEERRRWLAEVTMVQLFPP